MAKVRLITRVVVKLSREELELIVEGLELRQTPSANALQNDLEYAMQQIPAERR